MSYLNEPSAKNAILLEQALQLGDKFKLAVVCPTNKVSLAAVAMIAERKLMQPILIGPEQAMKEVAEQNAINLSGYKIINIENPMACAVKAAELAVAGKIDVIMKGNIHTDELMHVMVSKEYGLRTKRRISHCLIMDIPTYDKLMIFADVAVNVSPNVMVKKDITQNAIDLAHSLGIADPQVALLAAVETVHDYMPSTLDAAVLCKMAQRGQITGATLDGPLSIDLAIDKEAMQLKNFATILKDIPDVFIVPDLNSGNIAIKILDYMAHGQSCGVVLGAKMPIALMRRSSPPVENLVSCALAKIYCHHHSK